MGISLTLDPWQEQELIKRMEQRLPRLLPVHCCCSPDKRLGWVPVPAGREDRAGPVRFWIKPAGWAFRPGSPIESSSSSAHIIDTTIEHLTKGVETILAVKSAHLDVETWRQVPGFIADE